MLLSAQAPDTAAAAAPADDGQRIDRILDEVLSGGIVSMITRPRRRFYPQGEVIPWKAIGLAACHTAPQPRWRHTFEDRGGSHSTDCRLGPGVGALRRRRTLMAQGWMFVQRSQGTRRDK